MLRILLASIIAWIPVNDTDHYIYSSPNNEASITVPKNAKCPQWWNMALSVGWSAKNMKMLDTIMHRESRCILYARNRQDPNGGSFGLMQINGFWKDYCNLNRKKDLIDPSINLSCALDVFTYAHNRHGNGWGPWRAEE
jgi:hypothetical protein